MFERYSDKAKRVIFFARREAARRGSPEIEPEHILIALLREDPRPFQHIPSNSPHAITILQDAIEAGLPRSGPLPAEADLPLSNSSKRVLSFASEASQKLQHDQVGAEHLLIGVIQNERSLASHVLVKLGFSAEKIAEYIRNQRRVAPASVEQNAAQARPVEVLTQLKALINLLISRGVFTRKELFDELARSSDSRHLQASFYSLLSLLVQKGLVSEEERQKIIGLK